VEHRLCSDRITRPLRANGIPYRGINILLLWTEHGRRSAWWTSASSVWMLKRLSINPGDSKTRVHARRELRSRHEPLELIPMNAVAPGPRAHKAEHAVDLVEGRKVGSWPP